MRYLDRAAVRRVGLGILEGAGARRDHAATVTDHLIEASLMGVHSHGVFRIPQYVDDIRSGIMDPRATPKVAERAGTRILIEGRGCFGQVAGVFAVQMASKEAKSAGTAAVSVRNCGHTGRIGAYVERLAEEGMIGIAFSTGDVPGQRVAPFGGRDRRLGTNPLAYAAPGIDHPIVADLSTSTVPEGTVRAWHSEGTRAPEGLLLDADGNPSTKPSVLYEQPPGTIQLLGGPTLGHKGYALSLLVEIMATTLAGADTEDASRTGSNLTVFAVRPDPEFPARLQGLADYVASSRPTEADSPVLLPGALERGRLERATGVELNDSAYAAIIELAGSLGVDATGLEQRPH